MVCTPYGGRISGKMTMAKARAKRMRGRGRAMQILGSAGKGVWLVFQNRQMERCLRPKQTVKGDQGKSKKRLVCETRGVLGI